MQQRASAETFPFPLDRNINSQSALGSAAAAIIISVCFQTKSASSYDVCPD